MWFCFDLYSRCAYLKTAQLQPIKRNALKDNSLTLATRFTGSHFTLYCTSLLHCWTTAEKQCRFNFFIMTVAADADGAIITLICVRGDITSKTQSRNVLSKLKRNPD